MSATLLSARSFRPTSLGRLSLWLNASVESSLTLNGNTVSEWRDISGNERHFSQTTAAQQPNGTARTQNGLRVLDFADGQALAGNAGARSIMRNIGGATVCVAAQIDTLTAPPSGGVRVFFQANNNSTLGRVSMFMRDFTDTFEVGGRRLDSDSLASVAYAADTNAHVLTGVINFADSDAFIYGDGVEKASSTSFQTAGNTSDTDSGAISVGASVDTAGAVFANQFDGWIGEVIVYPRVLSSAERLAVERYLGRKWGIAVS